MVVGELQRVEFFLCTANAIQVLGSVVTDKLLTDSKLSLEGISLLNDPFYSQRSLEDDEIIQFRFLCLLQSGNRFIHAADMYLNITGNGTGVETGHILVSRNLIINDDNTIQGKCLFQNGNSLAVNHSHIHPIVRNHSFAPPSLKNRTTQEVSNQHTASKL